MNIQIKSSQSEHNSDEMKDILQRYSSTSSKWVIYTILLFITALLVLSLIIEYPETINANLRIISQNQPYKLIAKSNGSLILFRNNKDVILKDNLIIGYVKNDAQYKDVANLKNTLIEIHHEDFKIKTLQNFMELAYFNLGSVTSYYNHFIECINNYLTYNNSLVDSLNKSKLNEQLISLNHSQSILKDLILNANADLNIQKKRFIVDSMLYNKNIILKKEYQESKLRYIRSKQSLNQLNLKLEEKNISTKQTQFEIKNYCIDRKLHNSELYHTMLNAYRNLNSQIKSWETKHLLKASIPGILEISDFKENGQYVKVGEKIAKILPSTTKLRGQVFIPTKGAGEINIGSTINISLDDYSYFDYGYLKGKLISISNVTDIIDNTPGYWGELEIIDPLQSPSKKQIEFTHEMQGKAEIITKRRKLFFRIFNHLNNIFQK